MSQTISSPSSEGTIPFVELFVALRRLGANPPSYSSLKSHAYSGRFDYLRLPSGKLAVRVEDLPAIAGLYPAGTGIHQGVARAA